MSPDRDSKLTSCWGQEDFRRELAGLSGGGWWEDSPGEGSLLFRPSEISHRQHGDSQQCFLWALFRGN